MSRNDGFAADAGCVRIVDVDTHHAYYLTLDVHKNKDDLEQSSFDLKVTDGCRAWKIDGVHPALAQRHVVGDACTSSVGESTCIAKLG